MKGWWTQRETKILRAMWRDGCSASFIAKHLEDKTRNAVIGKVHRLKLPARPSPIKRAA